MVSSVNSNSYSLSQLMMFYQQQQAQLNAANNTDIGQTSGGGSGSSQDTSSANNNSLVSSPALGLESLLSLLQTQQTSSPTADADTSGQQSNTLSNSFQQDFQNLVSSINSGDLAGAQQAYSTLSQLQAASSASDPNASTTAQSSQDPFEQALDQIGSDLQSGNITGAQQTLTSLQQTQEAQEGHHHHHGGGGSGGGDLASLLDGSSSTSSSSSSSSSSSTTQPVTVTNADGSVTTITTNADGSVTTNTTPAIQTTASGSPTDPIQDLLVALEQQLGTV